MTARRKPERTLLSDDILNSLRGEFAEASAKHIYSVGLEEGFRQGVQAAANLVERRARASMDNIGCEWPLGIDTEIRALRPEGEK